MKDLWDSITDPLNVPKARARLQAELAKEALVAGMQDLTPDQQARMEVARGAILAELGKLSDYERQGKQSKDAFVSGVGLGVTSGAGGFEKRASGGPVSAGDAFLVGERGPELFVPRSGGSIVSNGQLGSGGGTSLTFGDIIVNGVQDPATLARELMSHVRRELTRQGMSFG